MLAAGCRQRLARFWGECYGQRQNDDQAYHESQGFRPAVVSHKHHPLSALSRREWLTACLQQTPAGFPRHFLLYGRCRFQSMCFLLLRSFSPVLARKISSQHQTSTAPFLTCGRNRATPALPCSLLHFPTSTPKPRAEGSSPSAPATKPAETLRFCRFSFYMCCMVMVFTLVQTAAFRIRLSLPTTVLILSST